ncbi:MAG: bifunctional aspartate kinase/homoserine dehydrogenase I [Aureispira sp.]
MLVLKFGGSSVASAETIQQVNAILQQQKEPFCLVLSAFAGTTDALKKAAEMAAKGSDAYQQVLEQLKNRHFEVIKQLIVLEQQANVLIRIQKYFNDIQLLCEGIFTLHELSDRTLARVMSFGERCSAFIIGNYLAQEGIPIQQLNSLDYIRVKGAYLKGKLDRAKTAQLISTLPTTQNYVVPGFIASNAAGETVLLGRGGSDYTAAIFADNLAASRLEIWSDVNGMLNANPNIVKTAKTITQLNYKEAFELSHFGAKVLYPPTIRPLINKGIPLHLKNTFHPDHEGTWISDQIQPTSKDAIKGISSINQLSLVTIAGVGLAGVKGMAKRVFAALEAIEVNVVLISQCSSEQNICIAIADLDKDRAVNALNQAFEQEINTLLVDEISAESNHAVIALVGDNMKTRVGLAGHVFMALGENGINVVAIAQGASERNISVVVHVDNEKKAVNVLHERFFDNANKRVHLFVAGIGNVGSKFLDIIAAQKNYLLEQHQIDLRLVGLSNSRQMHLNEEGINWDAYSNINALGEPSNGIANFIQKMKDMNLRNSVFLDNTASEAVSTHYAPILKQSVAVVTCNKIACSSSYQNYQQLKQLAKQYNCAFNYETTVGAALPVIKTIQNLVLSGDKVHKIQAVLSGSLNFIFNHYNTAHSFSEIVGRAKEEGYTEPNPLIDLSGVDVARKLLILAREANHRLEMDKIAVHSFLPTSCSEAATIPELFEQLTQAEQHFKDLYLKAAEKGAKLKVIATFEPRKAMIKLEEVLADSPFFHLEGKDNIVSINSERYPVEPLVIKGAGAGAELTAAGLFSDLMLVVNQ